MTNQEIATQILMEANEISKSQKDKASYLDVTHFIESELWHDCSKETPTNFGADILVLCRNKNKPDGIWLADLIPCWEGKWSPRENWEDPVKWCYLDSILPPNNEE